MNNVNTLLPHIKLHFNIEHPSFEDYYNEGYECALSDMNETANPFPADSKASEHWLEGWWDGFYGEPSLHQTIDTAEEQTPLISLNAKNDDVYSEGIVEFFIKVIEITGLIAVSALVGYQVIDLLAA